MCKLPKVASLIKNAAFWESLSHALHWETETTRMTRPYRQWQCENSHFHSYTELMLCVAGTHIYGVHGKAVSLSPGSLLLLPKQIPHDNWYSEHHAECVDLWLHLLPHGHVSMNFVEHAPGVKLDGKRMVVKDEDFLMDFQKACILLDRENMPSLKTQSFLFYLMLVIFEKFAQGAIAESLSDENLIIKHIKKYILENLSDHLSLDELARVAGYSPFHFHRIFTKSEKMTPRNFIEKNRIQLSCKLLEQGYSVTAAAFESGFSTSSQLAHIFKKHLQISPGQWIKQKNRE